MVLSISHALSHSLKQPDKINSIMIPPTDATTESLNNLSKITQQLSDGIRITTQV